MKDRIKVLILAKSVDGGTGTFMLGLHHLPKTINRPTTVKSLVLEKPKYRKVDKKMTYLHKEEVYPQHYRLVISSLNNFIKEIRWTHHQIKTFAPNILLGVGFHSNLLLMINKVLLGKKKPTILTTHIELKETLQEKSSSILRILLYKSIAFFYPLAEQNVCVSKGVAQSLKKNFGNSTNPIVINNGIKQPPAQKITPIKSEQPVFVTVTRLTRQKSIDNLLRAFERVTKTIPNSKLYIVGDGPTKAGLVRLTKKLKLENNVIFTGWTNNARYYLKRANIFVLSSKREGFPYILLEAMSYGKPVVATDTPHGPLEIVGKNSFGLIVPMDNVRALEKAMTRISSNVKLYQKYAKLSIKRSKDFTEKIMVDNYKKIILELVEK